MRVAKYTLVMDTVRLTETVSMKQASTSKTRGRSRGRFGIQILIWIHFGHFNLQPSSHSLQPHTGRLLWSAV